MNAILTFLGEHYFVAFFVGLPAFAIAVWAFIAIAALIIGLPFQLYNRTLRAINIRKHGWPPPHCDADGDPRKTEE